MTITASVADDPSTNPVEWAGEDGTDAISVQLWRVGGSIRFAPLAALNILSEIKEIGNLVVLDAGQVIRLHHGAQVWELPSQPDQQTAQGIAHQLSGDEADFLKSGGGIPLPTDGQALFAALADIEQWRSLPEGWDGEGGLAPSEVAVDSAKKFLNRLAVNAVAVPQHYVDGSGEISFRWRDSNGRLAGASFLRDGSFIAYCETPDREALEEYESHNWQKLDLRDFFADLRDFSIAS